LRIPLYFFSLIRPHPLSSTLFPYTTLFRSTLSNGQTRTPKFLTLTQNEVKYIEENYNWNDEEFLLVNFRMPSGRCHYDNYENLEVSMEWWKKFYSNIKLENVAKRFVFSDSVRAHSILDSKTKIADKRNFLLNKFFKEVKACHGVLIADKSGNVGYMFGECTEQDIESLFKKIKNY